MLIAAPSVIVWQWFSMQRLSRCNPENAVVELKAIQNCKHSASHLDSKHLLLKKKAIWERSQMAQPFSDGHSSQGSNNAPDWCIRNRQDVFSLNKGHSRPSPRREQAFPITHYYHHHQVHDWLIAPWLIFLSRPGHGFITVATGDSALQSPSDCRGD